MDITTEPNTPPIETPEQVIENTTSFLSNVWDTVRAALPTILFALIIFFIGLVLTRIVEKMLGRGLRRANVDDTACGFLRSLIRIAMHTLLIVIILSIFNVPMTSIVTIIGAAGLAVGLALQNSLSNLAGGFIILFAKPFKSGDYIETNDAAGTVEAVSILYTKIVTPDNKTIYIPNGTVSNAKIINYNEKGLRRLDLEFGISYTADLQKAKALVEQVIAQQPTALHDPAPTVNVGRHDESAVTLFARVWVKPENYWELNFNMLEQVKQIFDASGVEIPFPQLDVHMEQ